MHRFFPRRPFTTSPRRSVRARRPGLARVVFTIVKRQRSVFMLKILIALSYLFRTNRIGFTTPRVFILTANTSLLRVEFLSRCRIVSGRYFIDTFLGFPSTFLLRENYSKIAIRSATGTDMTRVISLERSNPRDIRRSIIYHSNPFVSIDPLTVVFSSRRRQTHEFHMVSVFDGKSRPTE